MNKASYKRLCIMNNASLSLIREFSSFIQWERGESGKS